MMPFLVEGSGDVVARVVYDGPPEAGKTTNLRVVLREIGERRAGTLKSPRSDSRQTEYFDWLEFPGGFIGDRKVHCQLLSVPGQIELAHRRKLLLETADVIVFVVESQAQALREARATIKLTLAHIEHSRRSVGLIVQANKQDLPGALAPARVLRELGLGDEVSAIPASAERGDGILYTFVMAARLAFDRARALLATGSDGSTPDALKNPADLLDALLRADAERGEAKTSERASPAQKSERRGSSPAKRPALPDPARMSAGHVWPPLNGRQYFTQATEGTLRFAAAFVEDVEIFSACNPNGWRVQSFPQDVFETEEEAQALLLHTVRQCLGSSPWIEPTLALAIYPDGTGWRLWSAHRTRPSLRELLVSTHDKGAVEALLARIEQAEAALSAQPDSWLAMAASLDGLVMDGSGIFFQAVRAPRRDQKSAELRAAAERVLAHVRVF
jgi:signal recognition particle receptor subunit beta